MRLNILISTLDAGIEKIKDIVLPCRKDVKYLVSHQFTADEFKHKPAELIRDDIRVSQISGKGVTKSRNNALRLAGGDIGLFSDDDVKYNNKDFDTVINTFKDDATLDIGLFKIRTPPGSPEYKKYPDVITTLKSSSLSIGTIEIAVRLSTWRMNKVFFDERFGAGDPYLFAGDEKIFIHDCIKKGYRVVFFPKYIVEHPYESTTRQLEPHDNRWARIAAAVDARTKPWIALPKAIGRTIKYTPVILRNRANPFRFLFSGLAAIFYVFFSKNSAR